MRYDWLMAKKKKGAGMAAFSFLAQQSLTCCLDASAALECGCQ
jgi:hypothetical protein